jgi:orotate phosphoribosyltransferase
MARKVSELIARRTGHFQMESGYHSEAWFELDSLFHAPEKLRPFVSELARRLSPHRPESVCGPMTGGAALAALIATELGIDHLVAERLEATDVSGLFPITYRIPPGQREMARGRSVAIVDDAISAGSAVRGTHSDLIACGARPVALGALIVFGDAPRALAAEAGLPL